MEKKEILEIIDRVQEELMSTDLSWVKLEHMRKAIEEVRYAIKHGYQYGKIKRKYGGLL